MKQLQFILGILTMTAFLIASCKKADEFYDTLDSIPELDNSAEFSYKSGYTVGDTMVLYGRLHPERNLVVRIGDAQAVITDYGRDSFATTGGRFVGLDKVRVLISEDMGPGAGRPVSITLGKYTVSGAPVEILSKNGGGYLRDTVKLGLYYSVLYKSVFFNHVGGKGNIYYYGNNKIEVLKKNATVSTLLTATDMKDDNGTAFTIQTMLAGTVDAPEKTLYFSALTTDATADNATNIIYRLCRYDITTKQLVTLNRTLIPKTLQDVRATNYQPFDGVIANAKLPGANGLYAANAGDLYLRINGNYAIAHLTTDSKLKYVYKNPGDAGNPLIPQVWDAVNNNAVRLSNDIVPGFETTEALKDIRISPDEKLMYTFPSLLQSSVRVIDLDACITLYQLSRAELRVSEARVVVGSFDGLTGSEHSILPVFWGYMPLNGERLVQCNYQEKEPSFTVLDFRKSRADYYAPGKCETGVFKLRATDMLLNYDEEGYLYMTANDGAQIVRMVVK